MGLNCLFRGCILENLNCPTACFPCKDQQTEKNHPPKAERRGWGFGHLLKADNAEQTVGIVLGPCRIEKLIGRAVGCRGRRRNSIPHSWLIL